MASASEKRMYRDLKKMDEELLKAQQEAAARVRPFLQSDMVVFRIGYNASIRSFKKMFTRRYRHMLKLCATTISHRPVCPPNLSFVGVTASAAECCSTFHIIEILHPERHGDGVQLMFHDSDLYFVAFRPFAKGRKDDGWFRFSDVKLPSHLKSHEIYYCSSYLKMKGVTIGDGCLKRIYDILQSYTPETAMDHDNERRQILRSVACMFSEAQRFWKVQSELYDNLRNEVAGDVGHLTTLFRSWGSKSRETFNEVMIAKETVVNEITAKLRKRRVKDEDASGSSLAKDDMYQPMSREILVYFYDEEVAPELIVWQRRAAAAKEMLETRRV